MPAGNDFTQCRTGRGLAASRRPFGDARFPVRHCAARAEVPPCRQTTQPKNEVLTSNRDLTVFRILPMQSQSVIRFGWPCKISYH